MHSLPVIEEFRVLNMMEPIKVALIGLVGNLLGFENLQTAEVHQHFAGGEKLCLRVVGRHLSILQDQAGLHSQGFS